jgi:hypothetical protein
MPRTIINLTDDDKRWLDQQARQRRVSMTSLVAEAVGEYRVRQMAAERPDLQAALEDTAGIWRHGDGLDWQQRMRKEWDDQS